jgi:cell division protein FtsL
MLTSSPSTLRPSPSTKPKRSWFLRTLIGGLLGGALFIAILLVTSFYLTRNARTRLEEVIAKLDRTDPNWRLEDLEKDVPPLTDNENNALIVQQILAMKPADWPSAAMQQQMGRQDPQRQLTSSQAALLKHEMERSPSSIALIRKLADVPNGYQKINWAPDGISTLLPLVQQSRTIAQIASYDATLRTQERDIDGALESCRAALVAGRSVGPCFTLIQGLVRIAIQAVGLNEVERTLAQGEPSEAALARLQNLLEDELAQSILYEGFRGERGMSYRAIEFAFKSSSGKADFAGLGMPLVSQAGPFGKLLALLLTPFMGSAESNQIMCLETLTELMEVTKLPESKQEPEFARIEAMAKDWRQPMLFRMLLPAVVKVHEADLRSQARLRAAVASIATERYRRKHGAWPEKLESLVPAELKQVGIDPSNGEPLIFKRLPDGLVIYSVGSNRIDDGGLLGGADIGFRLWDVNQRRQKPFEEGQEDKEK